MYLVACGNKNHPKSSLNSIQNIVHRIATISTGITTINNIRLKTLNMNIILSKENIVLEHLEMVEAARSIEIMCAIICCERLEGHRFGSH